MFHRFRTEVTLVQRSEQLLAHGYEPEVSEAIREVFEKEGIKVRRPAQWAFFFPSRALKFFAHSFCDLCRQ